MPSPPPTSRNIRVLHFVNGDLRSGALHVAVHLVKAALGSEHITPLLVVRGKRKHPAHAVRKHMDAIGIPTRIIPHYQFLREIRVICTLARICREFRPDILIAHGFKDHLWGRYGGWLAGVPHLVHVEHNTRESYTPWKRAQTRWLAKRTTRIVGVSEDVRQVMLEMGMPPERTITIPNGIDLGPFSDAALHPLVARIPGIIMVARIDPQKDHACLLQALAILRERGLTPPLSLAGSGKGQAALVQLVAELGLHEQVDFLGQRNDIPELLLRHRICALMTHYEGMPLSLVEGMAAGCAVIASHVPGVREVITDGSNGILVAESAPNALADALERLLRDDALATRLGNAARNTAIDEYGRQTMNIRYERLFLELMNNS